MFDLLFREKLIFLLHNDDICEPLHLIEIELSVEFVSCEPILSTEIDLRLTPKIIIEI